MRPCKTYEGVRTRYEDVDLVIVRETTEDIYAGIEFEHGTPDGVALIDWLTAHGQTLPQPDSGISIKPISVSGTRRVFEFAFDFGQARSLHIEVKDTSADRRRVPADPKLRRRSG